MKKREKMSSKSNKKRKIIEDKKPPNSSWQIFVEGSALYILCIIGPGIFAATLAWYRQLFERDGILHNMAVKACSLPMASKLQWCLQNAKEWKESPSLIDALAPDAGISDVAIVVFLSLSFAVVRVLTVHFLVPEYKQPKRLKALVRCKSISLLSSSYQGTVTPQSNARSKNLNLNEAAMMPAFPSLGGLGGSPDNARTEVRDTTSRNEPIEAKTFFGEKKREKDLIDDHQEYGADDWTNKHSDDDWDHYDDQGDYDENEFEPAPAVSSGLLTSTSAQNLQTLLQQATPMVVQRPSLRRESLPSDVEPERIYAAPKYATAVFRLIFCTVSCSIALFFFLDADFWPPAVGGSGSTKRCWDLSSVGTAVMDSDFDQHNAVLRRYFLLQASYHFHSGAFHVLAAMLLWFVSSSSKNQEKTSFLSSGIWTIQNAKSLFQHVFAVGLIAGTYLFSSTRRLGAIGMFAFDFSSAFLHLLQLCINAPYEFRRISPSRVRVFALITFCYSRFYVFPFVIGYSALEESQDWLRQLENMLVPGVAKYIHGMFVVSFCLLMIMNFVYFRRLINHSHVSDALNHPKDGS